MLNKILSLFLMLAIFFSDLIAMDDKPDENVMVLRSGRQIPKTVSVNSSLQLQTYPSQAADDEMQVKIDINDNKARCVEEERHPAEMSPTIPPVAQGHEEIYQRFLNGALIYRPTQGSDAGMVTLLIRELTNPLEGTFDLSRCGDRWKYLSISTGYRKEKKPENDRKYEIWIAPRFLIEKELNTTAKHFKPIMAEWKQEKAPVGLFWTWGGEAADSPAMEYLTAESMDNLSKIDLCENRVKSRPLIKKRPHGGMEINFRLRF